MEPSWEQRRPGGHTRQRQRHQGKELRFSKGFVCPTGAVPVLQPIPWSFLWCCVPGAEADGFCTADLTEMSLQVDMDIYSGVLSVC